MKQLAALGLVVGLVGPGCTALVLIDDAQPLPCADDADCAAGALCQDEVCTEVRGNDVPGEAVIIGADGGVVTGPDGVVLTIPPAALDGALPFTIGRASGTLLFDNFEPRSRFYAISPSVEFAVPAGLVAEAEGCAAVGSCQIFLRPTDESETWEESPRENAKLSRTGVFAVGVVVETEDG